MIYYDIVNDGNGLCFDVGANVGNRTQVFLNVGFKKVIAVEPQGSCLLKINDRFRNDERVIIVNKALSDKVKIEKIYISNADTISSMDEKFIEEVKKDRFINYNWNSYEEVETTTIDELIKIFGVPDFIKIDVEGYELNVLKGLSEPVRYLSFEYTPELHDKSMMCIEQIESISDYVYNFSLGESLEYSFDKWVDKSELDSFLKTLIGKRDHNNNLVFGDIYAKKNKITMNKTQQVKTVIESHNYYKDKLSGLRKVWNLSDDCSESYSGRGSCTDTTEDIRYHLPIIIEDYNIKSITDLPCGDWNWMRLVDLKGIDYIGYDVIDEIIDKNNKNYRSDNIKFEIKDIINGDIRKSDLIICRDFTFHVSNQNVIKLLDNFKRSGSKYLLSTSFENIDINIDIDENSSGYGFRKINLIKHPFNLDNYIYHFLETHPENLGRGMYLWKIN